MIMGGEPLLASRGDLDDLDPVALVQHSALELAREQCAQVQFHDHGFIAEAKMLEQSAHTEGSGSRFRSAVEDQIHACEDTCSATTGPPFPVSLSLFPPV